jgi:Polyketide cyclase / dehydrase and lipid transport
MADESPGGPLSAEPLPHDAEIVVDVLVDAPPAAVWAAITDWDRQSEWMLGTTVRARGRGGDGRGHGVGAGVEAFTGVGRLGFLDTMVITLWDPPWRCEVLHTGRVVRGTGVFEVLALPDDRSRLVWSEQLLLPLGRVGRLGFPVVAPALRAGVAASLRKLARAVEAEHAEGDWAPGG